MTVAGLSLGSLRVLERAKGGSLILLNLGVTHGSAVSAVLPLVEELANDLLGWLLGLFFTMTFQVVETVGRRLMVRREQQMSLVATRRFHLHSTVNIVTHGWAAN